MAGVSLSGHEPLDAPGVTVGTRRRGLRPVSPRSACPTEPPYNALERKELASMEAPKRYLRFCGIDVAKDKHVACVIDRDGQVLMPPRSFANDASGYQQLLDALKKTGKAASLCVSMEATGHYWYGLHEFLTHNGYATLVFNPLAATRRATGQIRNCKTDKLDAYRITTVSLVSLYGEVDPIELFQEPSQLVAFAGLDPHVYQSGQFDAPQRRISKRGSPFLRLTIWRMAHRAIYQEGDLRQFWLHKKAHHKHHLAAVTAVAGKLCHIIWRIMTDQRDYVTHRPTQKS